MQINCDNFSEIFSSKRFIMLTVWCCSM